MYSASGCSLYVVGNFVIYIQQQDRLSLQLQRPICQYRYQEICLVFRADINGAAQCVASCRLNQTMMVWRIGLLGLHLLASEIAVHCRHPGLQSLL